MLQQEQPDDFCIATGVQYSVRDFVNFAWDHLNKKIRWEGEGKEEKGYDQETGELIVAVDPRYFRPTEVETLLGDPCYVPLYMSHFVSTYLRWDKQKNPTLLRG